jgi:signal transduction histidine kinase
VPHPASGWIRAYAGVPIMVDEQVFGFLNLDSRTPDFFTPQHAELLKVFAAHAALAIRNAQLFQRSQELAALEARQEVARELHDAISQTLLSAHMFAETLSRTAEREPARLSEGLSYLRRTIRGALAELRALLVELRPSALLQANLKALIQQLAEAATSRKEIEIQLTLDSDVQLPDNVKVAVYRITQEALNNIVNHAHARRISIEMQQTSAGVSLTIVDNGRGFDASQVSSDRMGLAIMRERANEIGARFSIDSQIGRGTTLTFASSWSMITTWYGEVSRCTLKKPRSLSWSAKRRTASMPLPCAANCSPMSS